MYVYTSPEAVTVGTKMLGTYSDSLYFGANFSYSIKKPPKVDYRCIFCYILLLGNLDLSLNRTYFTLTVWFLSITCIDLQTVLTFLVTKIEVEN